MLVMKYLLDSVFIWYSLRPQILLFLADFRQISVANKRPFYPQLIWVPPFNHAR